MLELIASVELKVAFFERRTVVEVNFCPCVIVIAIFVLAWSFLAPFFIRRALLKQVLQLVLVLCAFCTRLLQSGFFLSCSYAKLLEHFGLELMYTQELLLLLNELNAKVFDNLNFFLEQVLEFQFIRIGRYIFDVSLDLLAQ